MAGSSKALLFLHLYLFIGAALAQDDVEVVEPPEEGDEDPNNVEIETYSGPVIGMRVEREGQDGGNTAHYEFLGIPYAEPPVDDLRCISFYSISQIEGKVMFYTYGVHHFLEKLRAAAFAHQILTNHL